MKVFRFLFLLVTGYGSLVTPSPAQAPSQINYQGRLLSGTNLVNGNVSMKLNLYTNVSDILPVYQDTGVVTVADGLYSTFIGDLTTLGSWPAVLVNTNLFMEVVVDNVILSPRERIASVAYAVHAWGLSGNAGTTPGTHFLGTIDNQSFDIRTLNQRVARFDTATNAAGALIPNVVLGHSANLASNGTAFGSVVGGGGNQANPQVVGKAYDTVAGGVGNRATGGDATVAGGRRNEARSLQSFVGGGFGNVAAGNSAVIGGGSNNTIAISADHAVIAGGRVNDIGSNSFYSVVGGGFQNAIRLSVEASIAGGGDNYIFGNNDGTGAGSGSSIGGGIDNLIGAFHGSGSGIFGGANTIGGGHFNTIASNTTLCAIGGGEANTIHTNVGASTITGGSGNIISNSVAYATIAGGRNNAVGFGATNAFAAGRRAKANHHGAFVWADDTDADFGSSAANQLLIRASGGVGINTTNIQEGMLHVFKGEAGAAAASANSVAVLENDTHGYLNFITATNSECGLLFGDGNDATKGAVLFHNAFGVTNGLVFRTGNNNTRMVINNIGFVGIANNSPTNLLTVSNAYCNGSTWVNASDKNLKQDFQPVDSRMILDKVVELPITEWNYRGAGATARHIGPMAQDFYAIFGLGDNDTSISTIDPAGVALAAIQALVKENADLKSEMDALKTRLNALETGR